MKDIYGRSFIERFEIDYIIFCIFSFIHGTQYTRIGKFFTNLFFIRPIMPFMTFFMVVSLGFIMLRYIKNPKYVLWLMVLAYLILEVLLS